MKNLIRSMMFVLMLAMTAMIPVSAASEYTCTNCTYKTTVLDDMTSHALKEGHSYTSVTTDGWVTVKGNKYYYQNGKAVTGLKKINKKNYYFSKKGVLTVSKRGIKIGKYYYKIDKKGIATKISEVEGLAGIRADKLGNVKKAFDWSKKLKYAVVKKNGTGNKMIANYAIYGFKTGKADCNVQAATFYYLAKAFGFKNMTFVQGKVMQEIQGKRVPGAHAWCEMKIGNKIYFYDPNLASTNGGGYKFTYGTHGTYQYIDKHNHKKGE